MTASAKPFVDSAHIAAIITAYDPPPNLPQRIAAIRSQVGALWLVDNSADGQHYRQWQRDYAGDASIHLMHNADNGLARAQNMALNEQVSHNTYRWALLLDDDSTPPPDMVKTLAKYANKLDADTQSKLAIIAPQLVDAIYGDRLHLPAAASFGFKRAVALPGKPLINPYYCYGSGTLLRLDIVQQYGQLHEPFGTYGVDMELGLRLRTAGYAIHICGDTTLPHRLGERTRHHIAGHGFYYTHHAPTKQQAMRCNSRVLRQRFGSRLPGFWMYDRMRHASERIKQFLVTLLH